MRLLVELIVETKDKIIKQKANSFLIQFFQLLERHLGNRKVEVKDINGNLLNNWPSASDLMVETPAGYTDKGIIVGSGTTAVDICNDYKIENMLSLDYGECTVSSTICSSQELRIEITREITNNTGADVEIKEVALYCAGYDIIFSHCIDRTILIEPFVLANGQTAKFKYVIKYVAS